MTIVRQGDPGLDAYQLAFQRDNTIGTLAEWLESLQGQDGENATGGSALTADQQEALALLLSGDAFASSGDFQSLNQAVTSVEEEIAVLANAVNSIVDNTNDAPPIASSFFLDGDSAGNTADVTARLALGESVGITQGTGETVAIINPPAGYAGGLETHATVADYITAIGAVDNGDGTWIDPSGDAVNVPVAFELAGIGTLPETGLSTADTSTLDAVPTAGFDKTFTLVDDAGFTYRIDVVEPVDGAAVNNGTLRFNNPGGPQNGSAPTGVTVTLISAPTAGFRFYLDFRFSRPESVLLELDPSQLQSTALAGMAEGSDADWHTVQPTSTSDIPLAPQPEGVFAVGVGGGTTPRVRFYGSNNANPAGAVEPLGITSVINVGDSFSFTLSGTDNRGQFDVAILSIFSGISPFADVVYVGDAPVSGTESATGNVLTQAEVATTRATSLTAPSGLGISPGSNLVIAVDSFGSNVANVSPATSGDWPSFVESAGYGVAIVGQPGYRLGAHLIQGLGNNPPWATFLSQHEPDAIIVAAGVNDTLAGSASFAPGGPLEDVSLADFFLPSRFTSVDSWNVLRINLESVIASAKATHPGVPIVLFTVPPITHFIDGITSFRLSNLESINEWILGQGETDADITVYDLFARMEPLGEAGTSDGLHPTAATQDLIVNDILKLLN